MYTVPVQPFTTICYDKSFLFLESEALSVYRISAKTEEINEIKAAFNKGKCNTDIHE